MLDGQLTSENDALGLVADVQEDLVAVDLDDGALDDVAVIEVLNGLVNSGEDLRIFRCWAMATSGRRPTRYT